MRWASPGNVVSPFWIAAQVEAERDAGGDRAGRVLRVVRAAQRADAGELRHRVRLAASRAQDARAFGVDSRRAAAPRTETRTTFLPARSMRSAAARV